MFPKVTVALLFLTFGSADAQEYVGSSNCKLCHKKEDVGNQYAVWQGERHSKAYLTLGTPGGELALLLLGSRRIGYPLQE